MRHAVSSRLALPILVSCLALAACGTDLVTQAAEQACTQMGYPDDTACADAFRAGYADADQPDATLNDRARGQATLMGSAAYMAGARYAQTHR